MAHRTQHKRMRGVHRAMRVGRWLLVGGITVLLLIPVVAVLFITAVPLWVGLGLVLADLAMVVGAVRTMRTPLVQRLALVGGTASIAAGAVVLSQVFATTPLIHTAEGDPLPGSIAVMERVELNGSRQWITIRGRDVNNPVLFFLAGGPGGSELSSTRLHLGALEAHFIVVNWDQPGAGKSYGAVDRDVLTPERYIADAHALVQLLRARFDEEKIYLMGESWGTILGIWLVRDYPDLFHAYVGSGQMVNTTENDVMGYEFALQYLAEQGHAARIETLRRNGPPPYREGNPLLTYAAYLDVLNGYMGRRAPGEGQHADILVDAIGAPEYGLWDKVNWVRGLMKVFNTVYPQLENLDLMTQAATLDVPVYFFVGRHDVNAMAALVERYYAVLEAPHKEIVWFEQSGHRPLYEEPTKWVRMMVQRVLNTPEQ